MPTNHTADLENKKFDTDGNVKTAGSISNPLDVSKTKYSATEITALGSSTDVSDWMAAYNDGMLLKKYVDSYDGSDIQEAYYTHPSLGDGNKSLKLVYSYATPVSGQVVKSITPSVADWTFDSTILGSVTLTLGTASSPNPSNAIAVGTDIITAVTIAQSGTGAMTLAVSGTDASNYRVNNITTGTTGSSVAVTTTDNVVIETAADFSGSSYSHSVTVTLTNTLYSITNAKTFSTSGTFTSFSNAKYHDVSMTSGGTLYAWGGQDSSYFTTASDKVTKHAFEGLGFQRTGGNADKLGYPNYDEDYSFSIWFRLPVISTTQVSMQFMRIRDIVNQSDERGITVWHRGSGTVRVYGTVGRTASGAISVGNSSTDITGAITANTWNQLVCTRDASANEHKIYLNNTLLYTDTYSGSDTNNFNITTTYAVSGFYSTTHWNADLMRSSGIVGGATIEIDEVSTWNYPLPATGTLSVNSLYNSGTPADLDGLTYLIGWWRMGDGDNGSGTDDDTTTLFDMSSNSNNITVRAQAPTEEDY